MDVILHQGFHRALVFQNDDLCAEANQTTGRARVGARSRAAVIFVPALLQVSGDPQVPGAVNRARGHFLSGDGGLDVLVDGDDHDGAADADAARARAAGHGHALNQLDRVDFQVPAGLDDAVRADSGGSARGDFRGGHALGQQVAQGVRVAVRVVGGERSQINGRSGVRVVFGSGKSQRILVHDNDVVGPAAGQTADAVVARGVIDDRVAGLQRVRGGEVNRLGGVIHVLDRIERGAGRVDDDRPGRAGDADQVIRAVRPVEIVRRAGRGAESGDVDDDGRVRGRVAPAFGQLEGVVIHRDHVVGLPVRQSRHSGPAVRVVDHLVSVDEVVRLREPVRGAGGSLKGRDIQHDRDVRGGVFLRLRQLDRAVVDFHDVVGLAVLESRHRGPAVRVVDDFVAGLEAVRGREGEGVVVAAHAVHRVEVMPFEQRDRVVATGDAVLRVEVLGLGPVFLVVRQRTGQVTGGHLRVGVVLDAAVVGIFVLALVLRGQAVEGVRAEVPADGPDGDRSGDADRRAGRTDRVGLDVLVAEGVDHDVLLGVDLGAVGDGRGNIVPDHAHVHAGGERAHRGPGQGAVNGPSVHGVDGRDVDRLVGRGIRLVLVHVRERADEGEGIGLDGAHGHRAGHAAVVPARAGDGDGENFFAAFSLDRHAVDVLLAVVAVVVQVVAVAIRVAREDADGHRRAPAAGDLGAAVDGGAGVFLQVADADGPAQPPAFDANAGCARDEVRVRHVLRAHDHVPVRVNDRVLANEGVGGRANLDDRHRGAHADSAAPGDGDDDREDVFIRVGHNAHVFGRVHHRVGVDVSLGLVRDDGRPDARHGRDGSADGQAPGHTQVVGIAARGHVDGLLRAGVVVVRVDLRTGADVSVDVAVDAGAGAGRLHGHVMRRGPAASDLLDIVHADGDDGHALHAGGQGRHDALEQPGAVHVVVVDAGRPGVVRVFEAVMVAFGLGGNQRQGDAVVRVVFSIGQLDRVVIDIDDVIDRGVRQAADALAVLAVPIDDRVASVEAVVIAEGDFVAADRIVRVELIGAVGVEVRVKLAGVDDDGVRVALGSHGGAGADVGFRGLVNVRGRDRRAHCDAALREREVSGEHVQSGGVVCGDEDVAAGDHAGARANIGPGRQVHIVDADGPGHGDLEGGGRGGGDGQDILAGLRGDEDVSEGRHVCAGADIGFGQLVDLRSVRAGPDARVLADRDGAGQAQDVRIVGTQDIDGLVRVSARIGRVHVAVDVGLGGLVQLGYGDGSGRRAPLIVRRHRPRGRGILDFLEGHGGDDQAPASRGRGVAVRVLVARVGGVSVVAFRGDIRGRVGVGHHVVVRDDRGLGEPDGGLAPDADVARDAQVVGVVKSRDDHATVSVHGSLLPEVGLRLARDDELRGGAGDSHLVCEGAARGDRVGGRRLHGLDLNVAVCRDHRGVLDVGMSRLLDFVVNVREPDAGALAGAKADRARDALDIGIIGGVDENLAVSPDSVRGLAVVDIGLRASLDPVDGHRNSRSHVATASCDRRGDADDIRVRERLDPQVAVRGLDIRIGQVGMGRVVDLVDGHRGAEADGIAAVAHAASHRHRLRGVLGQKLDVAGHFHVRAIRDEGLDPTVDIVDGDGAGHARPVRGAGAAGRDHAEVALVPGRNRQVPTDRHG